MNQEMMLRVAKRIEDDPCSYSQRTVGGPPLESVGDAWDIDDCETGFCIAGHACVEAGKNQRRGGDGSFDVELDAERALELEPNEAQELFAYQWPAVWFRLAGRHEVVVGIDDEALVVPDAEDAVAILRMMAGRNWVPTARGDQIDDWYQELAKCFRCEDEYGVPNERGVPQCWPCMSAGRHDGDMAKPGL